jgi:hypothetical protein
MITAIREIYGRPVRVSFHPKRGYRVRRLSALESKETLKSTEVFVVVTVSRIERTMVVRRVDDSGGREILATLRQELWELVEDESSDPVKKNTREDLIKMKRRTFFVVVTIAALWLAVAAFMAGYSVRCP